MAGGKGVLERKQGSAPYTLGKKTSRRLDNPFGGKLHACGQNDLGIRGMGRDW